MEILCITLQLYFFVCIIRIVLSWIPMSEGNLFNAVSTVCFALTEPVFATVRNVLPRPGDIPIDFAPMVVVLALGILRGVLQC